MSVTQPDVYYDPYDFEIDSDPYPVWKALRDRQPLYYNERYDFFALSRFDDVRPAILDWQTYSSAKERCSSSSKRTWRSLPDRSSSKTLPVTTCTGHSSPGCSRPER